MNITDIKGQLHDSCILGVLSLSQYMPTEETLNQLAKLVFTADMDLQLSV